jgi:ribosomal protein S18 acetylase RimI-like enzyme
MTQSPIARIELRPFVLEDHAQALELWKRCPGIGLSSADEREAIAGFLSRNPGLSFAAWRGRDLVGTSLCGSDGRRGYLYHLAVDPAERRRGLGSSLASASLGALASTGIRKCHLFVLADNEAGAAFWRAAGWTPRGDIAVFSKET